MSALDPGVQHQLTRVLEREYVIVGGGNRSTKVRLPPEELRKLPGADEVDVAVPR